jgi:hypothetical protein
VGSDVSPTGKTGLSHADDDDDDVMMGMDDHTIRRLSACPGKPEQAEPAISRMTVMTNGPPRALGPRGRAGVGKGSG